MKKNKFKRLAASLALGAALLGAQAVSAAGIAAGDSIRLDDSYGGNSGGEFKASILTGAAAGGSFQTFCVEHSETFTPGNTLYVKTVNTGAVNGGNSNLDNGFNGPTAPSANFDPISYETAYLFTKFSNQTLGGYQFLTDTTTHTNERIADGTSLQRAIWYIEGEGDYGYSTDTQAQNWVTEAQGATASWTGIGNVRVLNLYKNAAFTERAQDQLYITPIPEPEIYAMLAAGLGLMGFVARRRKQYDDAVV